ncbi:hypothetical protein CHS0354_019280 [Potamilus streckersoni]|uniref:MICOS complex subunit MIC13 n=1 Tax=Potamilus streckersoni TaxID=2493646 RepID=A0AAE0RM75_9BIVA|nr:hypothetical protein CHS0354_019280 [Potamilus streckersoni]
MAATVLKTLAKLTIGVGAVYVTVDQGVWDGTGQGDSALNRVKQSVLPATSEYLQKVPSVSDVRRTVLSKWNSGVETAFTSMASTPEATGKYCRQATNYIKKSLKS